MAKQKTTETQASVTEFIAGVDNADQQRDSTDLLHLMQGAIGQQPKMWGPAIIGFGSYHYKYDSGHEGDAPLVAFSPRRSAISLYLPSDFAGRDDFLKKLGKLKTAKACIYIKKLADVDPEILKKMVNAAYNHKVDKHHS